MPSEPTRKIRILKKRWTFARTELSEGLFSVESAPGAGTTVHASWPV
jgi:hypothetical protein